MKVGSVTWPKVAAYPVIAATGYGVLGGSQPTPSCTSASSRKYEPGFAGAWITACTVRSAPGSTSPPSGVRAPSHTTVVPPESIQWYPRLIGWGPVEFHGSLPEFASVTASVNGVLAETCAGGEAV